MSNSTDGRPTILVVDDEQNLADLYAEWLSETYAVRTAYSGSAALSAYDDTVDVVLLDRRMPDLSGDEVLAEIRDRGGDCQVVMVTAVNPDFDILDMGFDGYLTKPVTHTDLHEIVEQMFTRREYDQQLQTYYRLVAKRAALVSELSDQELAANEAFATLEDRIETLESSIDVTASSMDEPDFEAAFRDLDQS